MFFHLFRPQRGLVCREDSPLFDPSVKISNIFDCANYTKVLKSTFNNIIKMNLASKRLPFSQCLQPVAAQAAG
jgi:hypothetical protein